MERFASLLQASTAKDLATFLCAVLGCFTCRAPAQETQQPFWWYANKHLEWVTTGSLCVKEQHCL